MVGFGFRQHEAQQGCKVAFVHPSEMEQRRPREKHMTRRRIV